MPLPPPTKTLRIISKISHIINIGVKTGAKTGKTVIKRLKMNISIAITSKVAIILDKIDHKKIIKFISFCFKIYNSTKIVYFFDKSKKRVYYFNI